MEGLPGKLVLTDRGPRYEPKYPMTPLREYYGLLMLMFREVDYGRKFVLNGVDCKIIQRDGDGLFEAVTADFGLALFFPGWYVGDTSITPVHCAVKGDLPALFKWLPTPLEDKQNIIILVFC